MSSQNRNGYSRYALYFKPRTGSALANFEAEWFSAIRSDQIIASPKRYGLHGTLKAPFHLKEHRTFDELSNSIRYLSGDISPIEVGSLVLKKIGGFLALVPEAPCPALDKFAFDWVRMLDTYRAPTGLAEIERRRANGLSGEEEDMLHKWGYPYVDKCFRFHITLTGNLSKEQADNIQPALDELLKPVLREPLSVEDVCLVGDPGDGKPFRLLERFSLTG